MPHPYQHDSVAACDQHLSCMAGLAIGIIHDINNAAGAILNNVSYIQSRTSDFPFPDNLAHIQHAATHLAKLSSTLQLYTRDHVVEVDALNLRPLIEQALLSFQNNAQASQINIDWHAPAGKLYALSNAEMLSNAMLAMLQNARESLSEGRHSISVSLQSNPLPSRTKPAQTLGCLCPASSYIGIRIKDSGCGIPTANLCRIFDPFFTTKMRAPGLGLAHVVGLVTHTNACLQIQSSPGRGTTMLLLLPQTS